MRLSPFCLFVCFVFALPLVAQAQTTLIFPEENFERLFTLPATREFFESSAATPNKATLAPTEIVNKGSPAEIHRAKVHIKGFIIGEDGKQKVWLTDTRNPGKDTPIKAHTSVKLSASNSVAVKTDEQVRLLKPGQTWMIDDGIVAENYLLDIATPKTANINKNHTDNHSENPNQPTSEKKIPDEPDETVAQIEKEKARLQSLSQSLLGATGPLNTPGAK